MGHNQRLDCAGDDGTAVFVGYLFKSGDLHYKTLQTIDQVGDVTIAGTDYISPLFIANAGV